MAAVSVTADNTRVNNADANTGWSNLAGGGPSPAAEPQLRYQGSNAVNRKVTSTASRQGVQYAAGSTLDHTAAANALVMLKVYVADFGDLNTTYGVEVRVGSSSSDYYAYCVAGTDANRSVFDTYSAQGGYLILPIDANISGWREATGGTPDLTAIDYYGVAAQFVAGGAKSENVAMDAIDVGTGLTLVGGDGADPDGVFQDFVDEDQGNTSNRWGYASQSAGAIFIRGMMTIGDGSTATVFNDNDAVVFYPDGYHSAGLFGVTCDLSNSGDTIDIGATLIGQGSSTTEDTRPDFICTGTTATLTLTGVLSNHRNVTFTSACTADGAAIECELLTQGSADIENCLILTNTATQVACLQDPTFGTTTDLNNTEFVQAGSGHAIEIDTPGTYDLQDITFTGYGGTPGSNTTPSSGANDAAIYNNSGGAVTINVNGAGNQPSIRNAASSTTTVQASVTVTVTVTDSSGSAIQDARVYLRESGGGAEILNALTNASGVATTSFTDTTPQAVEGWVRRGTTSPLYKQFPLSGSITSTGYNVTAIMTPDE